MNRYKIEMDGLTPLLMHQDNLAFGEKVAAWRKDPSNKELSVSGDDRSPSWTWLGYVYHDGKVLGVPSDNLMTSFREGGAKVKSGGKSNETYKKQTQSGLMIDGQQFDLIVAGKTIPVAKLNELIGVNDFTKHMDLAESLGFELLVKRAKVGQAKHVRVRPMFRDWKLVGSITVIDEELSGLNQKVLTTILSQVGSLVGLCDWRPSSPRASGSFGKFTFTLTPID